jgi:hypothetical protein
MPISFETTSAAAQTKQIPSSVSVSFEKMFPDAKKIDHLVISKDDQGRKILFFNPGGKLAMSD